MFLSLSHSEEFKTEFFKQKLATVQFSKFILHFRDTVLPSGGKPAPLYSNTIEALHRTLMEAQNCNNLNKKYCSLVFDTQLQINMNKKHKGTLIFCVLRTYSLLKTVQMCSPCSFSIVKGFKPFVSQTPLKEKI